MKESEIDPRIFPSLISLWGAMIGGAFGASAGLFGLQVLWSAGMGLCWGFSCSVPLSLTLLGLAYGVSYLLGVDFDETPLGCSSGSQLSGALGGITGMIGAVLIRSAPIAHSAADPRTFVLCWSFSALLPILMIVVAVVINRENRVEHWLRTRGLLRDDERQWH